MVHEDARRITADAVAPWRICSGVKQEELWSCDESELLGTDPAKGLKNKGFLGSVPTGSRGYCGKKFQKGAATPLVINLKVRYNSLQSCSDSKK